MLDVWINSNRRIYLDDFYEQIVSITNPEALKGLNEKYLYNQMKGFLANSEFEKWIAEKIFDICKEAGHRRNYANISRIASATLLIKYPKKTDWEIFMYSGELRFRLINCPIFKIIKNSKFEILLEININ